MAVEALARRGIDKAVREDQPADERVLELVAADTHEVRAAVVRIEDADAGVRVRARVRLTGADPEPVARVDRNRSDRERGRVVEERRPRSARPLPYAAVCGACVNGTPVDIERGGAPADEAGAAARVRPHRIAVVRIVAVVGLRRQLGPSPTEGGQVL